MALSISKHAPLDFLPIPSEICQGASGHSRGMNWKSSNERITCQGVGWKQGTESNRRDGSCSDQQQPSRAAGWDAVFPTPTDKSLKGTVLGKTRCPWGGGSRNDTSIPLGMFSSPVLLSSPQPTKSSPCRGTLMIYRITSPTR